jgi:hypothetical protein
MAPREITMTENVEAAPPLAGELELRDEGLEIPEELVGFVGEFQIRTPNVDGSLETTPGGLPEFLSVLGAMTGAGDYNEDIAAGEISFATPEFPERKYRIIDEREENDD